MADQEEIEELQRIMDNRRAEEQADKGADSEVKAHEVNDYL